MYHSVMKRLEFYDDDDNEEEEEKEDHHHQQQQHHDLIAVISSSSRTSSILRKVENVCSYQMNTVKLFSKQLTLFEDAILLSCNVCLLWWTVDKCHQRFSLFVPFLFLLLFCECRILLS